MELETTSTERPKKIKQAANLIYLSLLVGLIKSLLYETMTTQKMLSDPKPLTVVIITLLFLGWLGYMIGKGKNWARITFLILCLVGMLGYPFIVINEFQTIPLIGIVSIVQMLI